MHARSRFRLPAALAALVVSLGATGTAVAQAPTCNAAPDPGCLYVPAVATTFGAPVERSTTYTDAANNLREVKFLIRQPQGAPGPLPVVVWSHGGAGGKDEPENSMVEWSETTARAGYFSVSIAHAGRTHDSRRSLCNAIGIADDATCEVFKFLNWDRPHDIRAVLDALALLATTEFRGQIDMARLALGGHSAGAGATLTAAGARRIFVGAPIALPDPRPIAFLAFSPQQPGSEGFFDTRFQKPRHSWDEIDRPVLVVTGDGDSTCNPGPEPGSCIGDTPFGRRIAYERLPADGNKYHLYLHTTDAFHTLFQLNRGKCAQLGVDQQRCDEIVRWLAATGLAFLDAHLRQVPAAEQWLGSNRIEVASGGVAEWRRK